MRRDVPDLQLTAPGETTRKEEGGGWIKGGGRKKKKKKLIKGKWRDGEKRGEKTVSS